MITEILLKYLLGIIGLSLVVLCHESGHYIAARFTGIRVETFSIGFGRRLAGVRIGETDYRISLIPLGGYCRFYGETSFRRALEEGLDRIPEGPGEFYSSTPLRRIIVSLAGPAANVIFAAFVFFLLSWIGYQDEYTEPRIVLISEWSGDGRQWPADYAGLESGDVILEVGGRKVSRFSDLREHLMFRPGRSIEVVYQRDGRRMSTQIVPELNRDSGVALIGITSWVDPVIGDVEPDSAAFQMGFRSGDRFLDADGTEIPHMAALASILRDQTGDLVLRVENTGTIREISLGREVADQLTFPIQMKSGRSDDLNIFQAMLRGVRDTGRVFRMTLGGLRMLFKGVNLRNALSGPREMIESTGEVVREGFREGVGPGLRWSFDWFAWISVSLAILNLIPIPVLDGGQILLFLIEIVRKKTIHPRAVYSYLIVGTILVVVLVVAVTLGDELPVRNR